MKDKTSISLPKVLVAALDRLAGSKNSRSALIERILRKYLRDRRRAALHARDIHRINRAADRLNQEAEDVLEYQFVDK